jgi:hypothetical protein
VLCASTGTFGGGVAESDWDQQRQLQVVMRRPCALLRDCVEWLSSTIGEVLWYCAHLTNTVRTKYGKDSLHITYAPPPCESHTSVTIRNSVFCLLRTPGCSTLQIDQTSSPVAFLICYLLRDWPTASLINSVKTFTTTPR